MKSPLDAIIQENEIVLRGKEIEANGARTRKDLKIYIEAKEIESRLLKANVINILKRRLRR